MILLKHRKIILNVFLYLFLLSGSLITAQKAQRIAYIDMEYILENVPEYLEAQNTLDSKVTKWRSTLDKLSRFIEKSKTDLANEREILTNDLILEKEDEITLKQEELRRLENLYFGPNGDMFLLRKQLVKPIQDQVYNSLEDIVLKRKYDFVFDKSSDLVMLYSNKKYDISDLVLNEIVRERKIKVNKEKKAKKRAPKKLTDRQQKVIKDREAAVKKKEEERLAKKKKEITIKIIIKINKMRKLKSLLLVAFLTLGMSGVVNAQKVGHVIYERVIANMPETRALQAELAKITKTYKDDIDGMKKKLQDKVKKYTAEQAQLTEDTNKQRVEEVQADNSRIQQAEQAAYQDIQEKQNNKLVPIVDKARKAINEVAKEKQILYVLDASAGRGLLVSDGEDLYDAVKEKLGLLEDVKQPTAPAKN